MDVIVDIIRWIVVNNVQVDALSAFTVVAVVKIN